MAFGEALTEDKLETDTYRHFFRSRVGLVFQNPDIQLFCPKVYDEIAFGPLQLGLPEGEVVKRVDDVLDMLRNFALPQIALSPTSYQEGKRKG